MNTVQSVPVFTTATNSGMTQFYPASMVEEGDFIYFLGDHYLITKVSHSGQDTILEGESHMYGTTTLLYFSLADTVAVSI